MSIDTWQRETDRGVPRSGCMSCGSHARTDLGLVRSCPCCGGSDLRSVAASDAQPRHTRDLRDRHRQMTGRPL
jgi:hypothetical protein